MKRRENLAISSRANLALRAIDLRMISRLWPVIKVYLSVMAPGGIISALRVKNFIHVCLVGLQKGDTNTIHLKIGYINYYFYLQ